MCDPLSTSDFGLCGPERDIGKRMGSNHARYSGPSSRHQSGQPTADAYPSSELMKSIRSSGIVVYCL